MKKLFHLPICNTCFENILDHDNYAFALYLDICTRHAFMGKTTTLEYTDNDYTNDDALNYLESKGFVKTCDSTDNHYEINVLPKIRYDGQYCCVEKKHFG